MKKQDVFNEDINPDFRKVFCKSFLQKEYFSDRGAKVIIDDKFVPIFKIDVSSLEERSEDEKYLILQLQASCD